MSQSPNKSVLDGLDLLEAPPVQLPDRSRLHHLKPIGIGTPYVECFTSYVSRLAGAHHVFTKELIHKELQPYLPSAYKDRGLRGSQIYTCARALNGLGVMARDWVGTLELLTRRSDLNLLTMLAWKEVFPTQGLLRFKRAWCPRCYEKWKANGEKVYEPLLWAINAVTICLDHLHALISDCPHCGQSLPHLDRRYRSGYCSKCNGWLGCIPVKEMESVGDELGDEFGWHKWIVTNMGDLIAVSPKLPSTPTANRVAEVMSAFGRRYHEGNLHAFARWLGIPPRNVLTWAKGNKLPKLLPLLHVCYRLNISIVEFFTSDDVINGHDLNREQVRAWDIKEGDGKRINRDIIQRKLKSILSEKKYPPPTMKEVSRSGLINST